MAPQRAWHFTTSSLVATATNSWLFFVLFQIYLILLWTNGPRWNLPSSHLSTVHRGNQWSQASSFRLFFLPLKSPRFGPLSLQQLFLILNQTERWCKTTISTSDSVLAVVTGL
jgi:hypothetical protein